MKGLVGRLLVIFCFMVTVPGIFLLLNRPSGVSVNCEGRITGFGAPSFPLTSYKTGCRASVTVMSGNQTVCTGSGNVRGQRSVITCKGIDRYEGESLTVSAKFYNSSGLYATARGTFINSR